MRHPDLAWLRVLERREGEGGAGSEESFDDELGVLSKRDLELTGAVAGPDGREVEGREAAGGRTRLPPDPEDGIAQGCQDVPSLGREPTPPVCSAIDASPKT